MAEDIFISYSRNDEAWVTRLVHALIAERYSVWWDQEIRSGEFFPKIIENKLSEVRCVISVWSNDSCDSNWVRAESAWAKSRNKLVSIRILDELELPIEFWNIHTESFETWDGSRDSPEFRKLLKDIRKTTRTTKITRSSGKESKDYHPQRNVIEDSLIELLPKQLFNASFRSPEDVSMNICKAVERMKILGGKRIEHAIGHPAYRKFRPDVSITSTDGILEDEYLEDIIRIQDEPIDVECPAAWPATIIVLRKMEEVIQKKLRNSVSGIQQNNVQQILRIRWTSSVGKDLTLALEKSNNRPHVIFNADGAMRPEIARGFVADYEFAMPTFEDYMAVLRKKSFANPSIIRPLEKTRFVVDAAPQEGMIDRKFPGYKNESRNGIEKVSEVANYLRRLDENEGIFTSNNVIVFNTILNNSIYYTEMDTYTKYWVSMYFRRDLDWSFRKKNAFINVFIACWIQCAKNLELARKILLSNRELVASYSLSAKGFREITRTWD